MKKIIKMFICILFIFAVITQGYSKVYADSNVQTQVVDSKKVWTVKFNKPIKFDSSIKSMIKIVDSSGTVQNVQLEVSSDKKSIKVKSNENGYKPNEKYTLIIGKGLTGDISGSIKNDISMDFYVKDEQAGSRTGIYKMQIDGSNKDY